MTAEEFIKKNYTITNGGEDYVCNHSGQLVGAGDIAESYHQHKTQWIPVSERLPEEGQKVLVYSKECEGELDCSFGEGIYKVSFDRINNSYLTEDVGYSRWANKITHWMPLPPKPEEL